MNESEINVVKRVEHHRLATCPCPDCEAERERRELPTNSHIKRITPDAAYLLGFIPRRHPLGSLARELMTKGS